MVADDEREFSYDENSPNGPAHWGEIRPEWSECNSGQMQSPIDLLSERVEIVSNFGRLKRGYNPSNATLINRGHDMMSHDNRTAVIGIMYKIGRPDSFLSEMQRELEAVAQTHEVEHSVGVVNPRQIKFGSRKYYRYIGSLTVPPCTQNIIWTMVRKVRTVSREQVRVIREAVHDDSEANSRPIQQLHDRSIDLFRPKDRFN
ncbi:Alpha carbonic anhydrase 7 [Striga hermonthica]|uniref:Alpha carbonic anhydrase 7 n=1 Tax=Striga hermonthica TaxID=68872 RepID=A0A9N7MUA4_STRHE|nr:Alpha carbonic anhydrase 7 [Striga hermonthica]